MERLMRPDRLDADPNSSDAAKTYNHWFRTFTNFIDSLPTEPAPNKLNLLINYVAPSVYDYISECTTFDAASDTLKNMYIKPKNEFIHFPLVTGNTIGNTKWHSSEL